MLTTYENLVREHYHNPYLTNADLARKLAVSERKLYRHVMQEYGLSPNHYLRRVRLAYAADLVRSGRYTTVKEVALRVGFLKVSYFSKLYADAFGVRPVAQLRPDYN